MSNKIIIDITNKNEKVYKCRKCTQVSRRRFNIDRHFNRFHEKKTPHKTCCGKTFCTKGDFYKHKENIHKQKKKFTKRQKTSTFSLVELQQDKTEEISVGFLETQNENEILPLSHESSSPPKKYLLHKWQKNSSCQKENETPLINTNISRRTIMKRASKVKRSESSNDNISEENIKVYRFTNLSEENINEKYQAIEF